VLMDALRALDEKQLVPTGISVHEPSLDDVFLALTGRPARQAGPAAPVEGVA